MNIPRGSDSPTLNPVQTPGEEQPMTPLYLNNELHNYFDRSEKIEEEEV